MEETEVVSFKVRENSLVKKHVKYIWLTKRLRHFVACCVEKMFYMIDLQNFREKSYAVALGLGRVVPRKEIQVDLKRWFQLSSPWGQISLFTTMCMIVICARK